MLIRSLVPARCLGARNGCLTPELSGAAENAGHEAKRTTRVRLSAGLGLGTEKGSRGRMAFALCFPPFGAIRLTPIAPYRVSVV